jgi:hypothetical protein
VMVSERRTEDGGIVGVYSDITELKHGNRTLPKSRRLSRPCRPSSRNILRPRCTTQYFRASRTGGSRASARS